MTTILAFYLNLTVMGSAPFCVVDDFYKSCFYYDIRSCKREAKIMNGICVPK